MDNRNGLNEKDLDAVVGGALRWQGGKVFPKDNPDLKYRFYDYEECINWIRANWGGQIQNEDTLAALEAAGLVERAF